MSSAQPISTPELSQKHWWSFLEPNQQADLIQSHTLLKEESQNSPHRFSDYSYLVFPAAKAYEGYLKKLFLSLTLIDSTDYYGEHFRIGKSLNPSLKHEYPNNHIYTRLEDYCQGERLPRILWHTWKQSRNLLFHWFPNQKNTITLDEARHRIDLIIQAMDESFSGCSLPPTDHL